MFIRVRGKKPGDPLHEFDVSEAEARQHPDQYQIVDRKPVPTARPATFIAGTVKFPRPAKKRTASKPGETKSAPAGANS